MVLVLALSCIPHIAFAGDAADSLEVALPTATVTEIENEELTFALNFRTNEATEEQLNYYGEWYADFVLTVNQDVTFNAAGIGNDNVDGYLAGQYDAFGPGWVKVPFEDVTLNANEPLKIMEYAADILGEPGLQFKYADIYETVRDFDCGVYFKPEFLEANPNFKVTLELRMYNPDDETETYVIGREYKYNLEDAVAINMETGKIYEEVQEGLIKAEAGQTVALLKDVETTMVVVPETRILMQANNKQLPVKNGEGYKFFEVTIPNMAFTEDGKFAFQPFIEVNAHELLKEGAKATGVTINVRLTWKQGDGNRSQDFEYVDDKVSAYLDSYGAKNPGQYGQMFTLAVNNAENYENLTYEVVIKSAVAVEIAEMYYN